jgi:hypothetical protein
MQLVAENHVHNLVPAKENYGSTLAKSVLYGGEKKLRHLSAGTLFGKIRYLRPFFN